VADTNDALSELSQGKQRVVAAPGPGGVAERTNGPGIEERAEALREIAHEFPWSVEEMISQTGAAIGDIDEQHYQQLSLFDENDVVWCGRDVFDTGSRNHASRFRTVREWFAYRGHPGPFTCPSTFQPGSYSRRKTNVASRPFLVVESDTLSRSEIAPLFRWLSEKHAMKLRAVVDTGGKSLHAWFDCPGPTQLAGLNKGLPILGCDDALFNPAQPCRLAGAARADAFQHLVYFDE
jgi:hypothetical protein